MRSIEFESGLKLSNMFPGRSENSITLTENVLLLSRGRDSIKVIIDDMGLPRGSGVLLPTFACQEIYEPFSKAGLKNLFYRVNEDLTPDLSHIQEIKDEAQAVLIINYLGFLQPGYVYNQCKEWGMTVIEDGSHSFLSKGSGEHGDYYFASLRKLLPLLDGAILKRKDGSGFKKLNVRHSVRIVKFRFFRALGQITKASEVKRPRAMKHWLGHEMFAEAEKQLGRYPGPAAMSKLSINILARLDLGLISDARRRNYQALGQGLGEFANFEPVFENLPEYVVPFGFPVFSEKRSLWVNALDKLKIQAAPLWNLNRAVSTNVLLDDGRINRQMMLFPVGQDYSEEDMRDLIVRIKGLADGN